MSATAREIDWSSISMLLPDSERRILFLERFHGGEVLHHLNQIHQFPRKQERWNNDKVLSSSLL